jgi:hypothetical protein
MTETLRFGTPASQAINYRRNDPGKPAFADLGAAIHRTEEIA